MTRARKRLYFTYTTTRNLYGSRNYNMASRFLGELPEDLVEFERSQPAGGRFSRGAGGSMGGRDLYNDNFDEQCDIAEERSDASSFFNVGDKVIHATFGEGLITGSSQVVQFSKRRDSVIFATDGRPPTG